MDQQKTDKQLFPAHFSHCSKAGDPGYGLGLQAIFNTMYTNIYTCFLRTLSRRSTLRTWTSSASRKTTGTIPASWGRHLCFQSLLPTTAIAIRVKDLIHTTMLCLPHQEKGTEGGGGVGREGELENERERERDRVSETEILEQAPADAAHSHE